MNIRALAAHLMKLACPHRANEGTETWLQDHLGAPGTIAPHYRHQARRLLSPAPPEVDKYSLGRIVEQTALGLFERDLHKLPLRLAVEAAPPNQGRPLASTAPPDSLAHYPAYLGALVACLAGGHGALTPAVVKALEGFDVGKIVHWQQQTCYVGNPWEASVAARVGNTQKQDANVTVLGAWEAREAEVIGAALKEMRQRVPRSSELVRTVVVRTHVGGDVSGSEDQDVAGIYSRQRPQEIGLSRVELATPNVARTLFHEAGHELDSQLGRGAYRSHDPDTPFGKTAGTGDFVSPYARQSPHEDFAETHADVIANWDLHQRNPTLFYHAQGLMADKRRWILEEAYGQEVPPPSPTWTEAVEKVRRGETPFESPDDLKATVARLARDYPPYKLFLAELPEGPEGAKLRWAAHNLGP